MSRGGRRGRRDVVPARPRATEEALFKKETSLGQASAGTPSLRAPRPLREISELHGEWDSTAIYRWRVTWVLDIEAIVRAFRR